MCLERLALCSSFWVLKIEMSTENLPYILQEEGDKSENHSYDSVCY